MNEVNNISESELNAIFSFASGITFFGLGVEMLMNGISKYTFCKETSKKNIKISLPPYVKMTPKRDITEFQNNYRKAIRNFIKTIKWKLPYVSLNIFLYNLKDLKIETKDKYIGNKYKGIIGNYNFIDKIITLIKGDKKKSIYHELLHAASSIINYEANTIYIGFNQIFIKDKKSYSVGKGLNEGYTSLLEKRYFSKYVKVETYILEREISNLLESIIGIKNMEKLYFDADLYTLTKIIGQYKTEDEILTFLKNLDYLSNNKNSLIIIPRDKKQCLNCLRFCGKFLLELYMEQAFKCIKEMSESDMKLNTFEIACTYFAKKLQTKVFLIDKEYEILKKKESDKIINKFIDDKKEKILSYKTT